MPPVKGQLYIDKNVKKSMLGAIDKNAILAAIDVNLTKEFGTKSGIFFNQPQQYLQAKSFDLSLPKNKKTSASIDDIANSIIDLTNEVDKVVDQKQPFMKSFLEVVYLLIGKAETLGETYSLNGKEKKQLVISILEIVIKDNKTKFKFLGITVPSFIADKIANKIIISIVDYLIDFIVGLYNSAKLKLSHKTTTNKTSR